MSNVWGHGIRVITSMLWDIIILQELLCLWDYTAKKKKKQQLLSHLQVETTKGIVKTDRLQSLPHPQTSGI